MLLFTIIIKHGGRRDYRKLRERLIRRKFVSQLTQVFRKKNLNFQIRELPDGNILILLPQHFQRHEIRQINVLVERIYNKLWDRHAQMWSYAILHGPQVKVFLDKENGRAKKRDKRPRHFNLSQSS